MQSILSQTAEGLWWYAIWIGISLISAKSMVLVWQWILLPLAKRTRTQLDIMVLHATQGAIQWVVATAILNLGLYFCFQDIPEVTSSIAWSVIKGILYSILLLSITSFAYGVLNAVTEWMTKKLAAQTKGEMGYRFIVLFRKIAGVLLLFIASTIILDHFGIQVTGLLATAGVASLALALAAQETLSNMIAGFALQADRAFQPGDRIELANGKMGDVLEIGLRSTKIMSFDDTMISIPNSEIAKSQIINLNAPNSSYKIRCTIGVAYGTDIQHTKTILLQIMASHPKVLPDPSPGVYFTEFADSCMKILMVCAVADYRDQFRIRDELNMKIKDAFAAAGIEIPFPQQVVYLERAKVHRGGKHDNI